MLASIENVRQRKQNAVLRLPADLHIRQNFQNKYKLPFKIQWHSLVGVVGNDTSFLIQLDSSTNVLTCDYDTTIHNAQSQTTVSSYTINHLHLQHVDLVPVASRYTD